MLWIKAFHLIFMVTWFAGLFYLPRLFVYHAKASDPISYQRFTLMERKLFWGIMTPGAVLTLIFGFWLFSYNPTGYLQAGWFHVKLLAVVLLLIFHVYCGQLWWGFKKNRNQHGAMFYRIVNEVPTLLLVVIVILAVVKPF